MEPIRIKGTTDTPKVECDLDGTISISGKSLTEDPLAFYRPILKWVGELQVEVITFNFQLEYMNTSCSKEIFSLLMVAKENSFKKKMIVNWLCEATDEDNYEIGKEFESMLEVPFNIQQY
jgi:hypothetical protein